MSLPNYTLKVNRELLDPSFESYRLSLDSIPVYNVELDAGEKMAQRVLVDSIYYILVIQRVSNSLVCKHRGLYCELHVQMISLLQSIVSHYG